jgi:integrase
MTRSPSRFPFQASGRSERTPAYRIPSHGTDLLSQRYAYDLVRYEADPDRAVLLWLAATTGARRGELCALRWGASTWRRPSS